MVHIHFGSDDDEDMATEQQPAPSTSAPSAATAMAGGVQLPRCYANARVDFNFSDPCYVFKVMHNSATGTVAASVSNHSIKLYQTAGGQLSLVGELKGHNNNVTDLVYGVDDGSQAHLMLSSSADGTIRGWDTRSGQQVEGYQVRGQELLSLSTCGHMLAAGTSGEVLFWDRRSRQPLAKLEDTHADDVTQVRFHSSGRIISGSTDGLIAVHDVSKSFNDDDVFQAALNINTSVEELGLYGPSQERLWVRTGTESVHLWEWMRAAKEDEEGGDVPFAEFAEARTTASQAAAASGLANALPQVDYVIGCHYDAATDQALLVAGSNEGPVAFFPIREQRTASGASVSAALLPPVMALAGAHTSVVRSVACFGSGASAGPFCASGGEDAQVCLWSLGPEDEFADVEAAAPAAVVAGQRGSPGPERKHHSLPGKDVKRRPSPY